MQIVKVDFDTFIAHLEAIPEDTLADLAKDAVGQVTWVKFNESGFVVDGETYPTLSGVISVINPPYWACWDDPQNPVKIPNHEITNVPNPESFKRRCDIHVVTRAGLVLGVSMPATSYTGFCRYVTLLQKQNLNPADLITNISVFRRKGLSGMYNVLMFKPGEKLSGERDTIPF